VRNLLASYLDQRISFYTARDERQARRNQCPHRAAPGGALVHHSRSGPGATDAPGRARGSGINDVLNSQGYTQAAWWNRIPLGAGASWAAIAVSCNVLIGYGVRGREGGRLAAADTAVHRGHSFFLIADVDSPRAGVIRVNPQTSESLAHPCVPPRGPQLKLPGD
jgi:hypothetical protein